MLNKLFWCDQAALSGFSGNTVFKKFILPLLTAVVFQVFSFDLSAQQIQTPVRDKTRDLFQAIRSGSVRELENQLANGADTNDTLNGFSALMAATLNGSVEQIKILIDHGAKVNYRTKDGVSALWLAVPDMDKTRLLLDQGADVHQTVEGYGVLVKLAAIPGTIKVFQLLMDRGADPKKSAPDNYLLYNAASSGDTAILGLLIRNGLNVNDTVSFGDYPINAALNFRSFATLKMLVENGARVNVCSMSFPLEAFDGMTPLMFAAVAHDKPSLYYLLEHGADPNLTSKKGFTALMLLEQSETDDPEMTLALIQHGAVVSKKTPDGMDALYFAQKKGVTQSVVLLKKYTSK